MHSEAELRAAAAALRLFIAEEERILSERAPGSLNQYEEEQLFRLQVALKYSDIGKATVLKMQDLEKRLYEAESAGATMRQAIEADMALIGSKWVEVAESLALSHGYTMTPAETELAIKALQLRESSLATGTGKSTLARIEQLRHALQMYHDWQELSLNEFARKYHTNEVFADEQAMVEGTVQEALEAIGQNNKLRDKERELEQQLATAEARVRQLEHALKAWRVWGLDEKSGMGGDLFDTALELTDAALKGVTE